MTVPTMTTYDMIGKKEDVSDIISNIAPTKTPFQSSIATESVDNTFYQWQEDDLRSAATNAKVEGADASDYAMSVTTMRSNYTQIFQESFKITGTSDVVKAYGRAKESAYQATKTAKQLKRDLEYSLVGVGSGQTATVGTTSVARKFASVQAQIDSTTTITTDSDAGTGGNQAGPLTETNLLASDQALYSAGSEATILMIKPADSLLVAAFQRVANNNRVVNDGGTTITNVINVYVSPFGSKKVVINRFLKTTDALLYDPEMWKLGVLRNWFKELLAKTGDAQRYQMIGEFGLKHANKKASGMVINLT